LSKKDIEFLSVEISPIMRASAVDNAAEMQWALDVITLSNARRWGNDGLFEGKQASCIEKVKQLPLTLNIVKQHEATILECIKPTFWESASESQLDQIIHDLGPLMKHRDPSQSAFRVLDLKDSIRIRTWLEIDGKPVAKSKYQETVAQFISGLADQSAAVRKVRDGEMVTAEEIQEIVLLFEGCEHPISVENLREAWGAKRVSLEEFLAHILRGEDLPDWETKVRGEFQSFLNEHSTFNARQIEMLNALCNYVIDNETVAKPALVQAPFTNFDRNGFLGAFEMNQINEILSFTEALTA
jgi:type I site-specific restriction endonuclease